MIIILNILELDGLGIGNGAPHLRDQMISQVIDRHKKIIFLIRSLQVQSRTKGMNNFNQLNKIRIFYQNKYYQSGRGGFTKKL